MWCCYSASPRGIGYHRQYHSPVCELWDLAGLWSLGGDAVVDPGMAGTGVGIVTTVVLENVGGGGEHGGSVGVRTCDPDERTPCTVSSVGSIRSIDNVSVLFLSPFVVVKTSRLGHFVSVATQFHATARASHPQIDCWPCFFKCRR